MDSNQVPVYRLVARAGRVAGVCRVGSKSSSGRTAQGMYEGRLTTARDGIATAGIERSGMRVSAPSRFRKSTRETADCETARGDIGLYMAKCHRKLSPLASGVRETKRLRLRLRRVGLGLRPQCLDRNKMCRQFCVECSIRVEAIATGDVGTRVHWRSDTEGPLSVTRA